ncbi:MAG: hypothetical protein ING19_16130, partial [Azospirillum sp.]|nr:hypothetical protein [Azospirillum sp.]
MDANARRDWKLDAVAMLEAGGPISRLKPGYRPSRNQIALTAALVSTLQTGYLEREQGRKGAAISIAEAATGTGKTLATLLAAAIDVANTGGRELISTHTLALQRQIFGGAMPAIRKTENGKYEIDDGTIGGDAAVALNAVESVLGRRPKIAIRRGMSNFVDIRRLKSHIDAMLSTELEAGTEETLAFVETAGAFQEFAAAVAKNDDLGLIEEFWERQDREMVEKYRRLFPDSAICLLGGASEASSIEATKFKEHVAASKEADILVVPHVYAILHAKWGGRVLNDPEDRKIDFALFDEADRLPDAAQSVVDSSISLRVAAGVFEKWSKNDGIHAEEDLAEKIESLSKRIRNLDESIQGNYDAYVRNRPQDFCRLPGEKNGGFLMVSAQAVGNGKDDVRYEGPDGHLVGEIRGIREEISGLLTRRYQSDLEPILEFMYRTRSSLDVFLRAVDDTESPSENAPVAAIAFSPKRIYVLFVAKSLLPARILSLLWEPRRDGEGGLESSEFRAAVFVSASISGNTSGD